MARSPPVSSPLFALGASFSLQGERGYYWCDFAGQLAAAFCIPWYGISALLFVAGNGLLMYSKKN